MNRDWQQSTANRWAFGGMAFVVTILLLGWLLKPADHQVANNHRATNNQVKVKNAGNQQFNPHKLATTEEELNFEEAHQEEERFKSLYQIPRFLATAKVSFEFLDRSADAGHVVIELANVAEFDGNDQIFDLLDQWRISPQEKAEDDPFLVLEEHSFGDYRALESNNKAIIYKIFVGKHLSKICVLAVCCAEGKTKQLFSIQRERLIPISD